MLREYVENANDPEKEGEFKIFKTGFMASMVSRAWG